MLTTTRRRIVLCYHNITPAEFFADDYPEFAEGLRWGRHELEVIRSRVVAAVADSRFNADELATMGYEDVRVMAAGLDPLRLSRVTPEPADAADVHAATDGWDYIVAVAQQLPHKRLDVVIQAVHLLQTVHRRQIGLVVVGADRFPLYGQALRTLATRLRVRSLWFPGSVLDTTLVAILRGARVFVSASCHEGLGLPPIEAMAFDLPVVARGVAAVPETVGDAGLL
ncbi:MAG: glycosyltransferase, partial [Ilumatobacteraceae bacterium]